MATTLSQNIIARATGEDPNRGIMDGVFDAGIVGGAQGAGASAIRKGLDVLANKKSKGKVDDLTKKRDDIVNDLDNDAIPDSVKEQLEISLEGINQEINNTLDENRNEINNLPEETKLEVAELADKIETINESLQNETISETSKTILEQDLKDAQAELDAKFKLAKPTFDTEEQLIAEGQQAEAEYTQTGDQVTYEQKIKELEEREKNLVPAPEDAEIGKPEEVVKVEPIRQLGTGDNVYFETEKYRVNDTLKNEKVLLNIQSQTSEIPIANIEFDNANDAVIIAQELNNKFPDGVPDAILIDKYIEQLKNDLLVTKPQTDAVQVEAAGQVPVLTEATVGEEVEQGKPQPEAEGVTEEGKEKEGSEVGGDVNFTEVEDKKIKDIATEANIKIGSYVKSIPTDKKNKFGNSINEYEATNPFTNEKITFKKQGDATDYVIKEIAKATTKSGREEIFKAVEQSLAATPSTEAKTLEQLRAEEQAIKAVDYKGKKISDVKIGDVYYDYYAGAIRKFERLPNREKENGEEVYFSKVVDENIFSEGSPDDVIGFNESDYLKSRPAETFLENAENLFYKNPFSDVLEVFGNDGKQVGWVALNKVDSDTVDVDGVVSITGGKRKGGGSQIMKMVTKNADRTGVTLTLVPEPLPRREAKGFETPEKLQAFYEKFGFVKDKKKPTMTRKPQPVLPQTIEEQIAELRIREEVELRKAIEYNEKYQTDFKIDRAKITDAKDLKKFDDIYDKYDKLITPLLPKKEAPAKAEPKLKSKVATRLLFKKAVDLFYDISGTEGIH